MFRFTVFTTKGLFSSWEKICIRIFLKTYKSNKF